MERHAAGAALPDRLRAHFGHRDHLYGVLLAEMADDWDAGGVTRQLFAGWEDAESRQFPQLRLLAGLFRVVLRGDAPQLVPFYPCLGGTSDPEEAWAAVRPVLAAHVDELHAALAVAPQTNEPGRSVALLVGLSEAVRRTGLRRVRLLELGASAGLGLLVDRYHLVGRGWSAGPEGSPLVVAGCDAAGFDPEPFAVVERRGCDLEPVDASTEAGGDHLRSFVWPWMLERHARLEGALAVLASEPVAVDRASAGDWLAQRLAEPVGPDVLTVVWHSVTRMYWPQQEVDAVEAALAEARTRMPLAHVAMEIDTSGWGSSPPPEGTALPTVTVDGDVLGTCGHHGPPMTLA